MYKFYVYWWVNRRDSSLLILAIGCLLVAVLKPTLPVSRDIHTYFLVADISQSMNSKDMQRNGKTISRLAYTQRMMHDLVAEMPCHTQVSIGVFAGDAVAALYTPLEVCKHFAAIQETIEHLDWRMAWSGNSRLRESLLVSSKLAREMPEATKVVYFTDGDEAPLLHAFNTNNLKEFQGGQGWFFVGIGSEKGVGIPKMTEDNQVIGFWSNESFAVQPNIAQVTASKSSGRDDSVAISEYDRYISKKATTYLQKLAQEIGAHYVDGDDFQGVNTALRAQPSTLKETVPYGLDWLLALFALLAMLVNSMGKHSLDHLRKKLPSYRKRMHLRWQELTNRVAHDNEFV